MPYNPSDIRGVIFDYGGTIDSHGDHWSQIILDQYKAAGADITFEKFKDAYIHGERYLDANRIILPGYNFLDSMQIKIAIEFDYLHHVYPDESIWTSAETIDRIAHGCYNVAKAAIDDVKPALKAISQEFPTVIVSNFYGNINAVLSDFGIRHLFCGVIESTVVGIRKPDPRIFELGCLILDLPAENILVVGDTLSKDIRPAKLIGCQTAMIAGRPWPGSNGGGDGPTEGNKDGEEPTTLKNIANTLLTAININMDKAI